jgi:hypothetical protein
LRPALFLFGAGLVLFGAGLAPCALFSRCFAKILTRLSIKTQRTRWCQLNLIQHSFELAAERCDDLAQLGSIIALTIDAMLDFAGDRTGHFRMIECEVI